MTPLVEKDLVLAPLASADRFLHAFVAAHPALAALERIHRPGDMTPRYYIHWQAESDGAFPQFDGELFVNADEDYNGFWLVLNSGDQVARSTARALLRELRVSIEAHFRAEERGKASQPSARTSLVLDFS